MLFRTMLTWLTGFAMLVAPVAAEAKTKYAKSEMDRAVGKCVGSVLGGALLGALIGRVVGGRDGTAAGAGVGAGAGAAVCAVLIANARHRDDIMRAQMAAAQEPGKSFTATWNDDAGQPVTYTTRASAATFDASQLVPVKYEVAGTKIESPELPAGAAICRTAISSTSNGGNAPNQTWCRGSDGTYYPYGRKEA